MGSRFRLGLFGCSYHEVEAFAKFWSCSVLSWVRASFWFLASEFFIFVGVLVLVEGLDLLVVFGLSVLVLAY